MGEYVNDLETRLRTRHHERVIATAALCGAEFEKSMSGMWTYQGATWPENEQAPYRSPGRQRWFDTRLKAARHFIKSKGIEVDYGF